jgi:CheY-like chemotaxis protein
VIGKRSAHILVVDDETTVRRLCARILEQAGYRTHEAADGVEALQFVRGTHKLLELVLSDIVMPRLNGIQLLQSLSAAYPDLPVLLMSAYGAEALLERGITAPCGVLVKPFTPEGLLAEVRRCLRSVA